jgi:DNA-binding NarL/FixJ family response regulator
MDPAIHGPSDGPARWWQPRDDFLPTYRILLIGMSYLTRGIVEEALRAQPDMAVVDALDSEDALLAVARRLHPDVVVAGVDGPELPERCRALLVEQPHVRVIGLEDDRRGHRHELAPLRTDVGDELSTEELVAAIRAAAQAEPRWGSAR